MASNFNEIWGEFNVPLRCFIRKRIHNDQDVDDVLQTVFMKIYNNIDDIEQLNHIQAWVYTITRNTIIDYYRMQKHDVIIGDLSEEIAKCEYNENLEDGTLIQEISQCLLKMIEFLPEKYKQALTFTEIDKISQKQLAEKIGLSLSGAKSRVQRARVLLKEEFLNCCNLEMDAIGNIIDYEVKNQPCDYCKD